MSDDRAIDPVRAVSFVLVGCGLYGALYLARWDGAPLHLFGDFFSFWTAGRFVREGHLGELYAWGPLHAYQERLLGQPTGSYPVPYPPSFLPVLIALGALPYLPAYALWIGGSLAASTAALPDRRIAWAVAPATLGDAIAGQNGLLSAALVVGGMRLAPERPILAGVLLGALSYKPQLFLLVPIALAAARSWKALLSTGIVAAGLALGSAAAFGLGAWRDWIAFLPSFAAQLDAETERTMLVSLTPALRVLGVGAELARAAQLVAAVAAIAAVVAAFRGGVRPAATAALLTATFLFTPYAYAYDLPLVAAAVLLGAPRERLARVGTADAALLFAAWVLPVLTLGPSGAPIAIVTLTALLVRLVAWARAG